MVVTLQDCNELRIAYNEAVQMLTDHRSDHIKMVSRYVLVAQSKVAHTNYEYLRKKGASGTDIMPFLKSIRDSTHGHLIM